MLANNSIFILGIAAAGMSLSETQPDEVVFHDPVQPSYVNQTLEFACGTHVTQIVYGTSPGENSQSAQQISRFLVDNQPVRYVDALETRASGRRIDRFAIVNCGREGVGNLARGIMSLGLQGNVPFDLSRDDRGWKITVRD